MRLLQLYLWETSDHNRIECFALAESLEQARELVIKNAQTDILKKILRVTVENVPLVVSTATAFNAYEALPPQ